MSKEYTLTIKTVWSDKDKSFMAMIDGHPSISAFGDSIPESIKEFAIVLGLLAEDEKAIVQFLYQYDTAGTISDGLGSSWPRVCAKCGEDLMQIVRPGDARCSNCD
jgi:predicted RNase H-like HicB family nuclease